MLDFCCLFLRVPRSSGETEGIDKARSVPNIVKQGDYGQTTNSNRAEQFKTQKQPHNVHVVGVYRLQNWTEVSQAMDRFCPVNLESGTLFPFGFFRLRASESVFRNFDWWHMDCITHQYCGGDFSLNGGIFSAPVVVVVCINYAVADWRSAMSGHFSDQLISFPLPGFRMRSQSSTENTAKDSILLRLFTTPWRILALVLVVVFAVEAGVMLLLPRLLPANLSKLWEALIDSALLTFICAPLLWWVIISPLRRVALEAQALSSTVVANAGDGIITVDSSGTVLSYNAAAYELFGHAPKEILAKPVSEVLPEISLASTAVGEAASTSGRRRSGEIFPASVSVRKIGEDDQSPVVIIVRDLTESLKAEQERTDAIREQEALRAQQMATLAQLATGVAHEIRNPLTAIKMLIQSTQSDGDITTLPTEDVRIVEDQIRRMEQSVTSLLDFARPSPAERRSLVLREIIPDVLRLLEGQARKQYVKLAFEESVGDLALDADRDQIQQLVLNLGLNALNVMPDGGIVRFSVQAHTEGMVCILVSDTGPGIPEAILSEIFKPFFTTRKQGVGLGLNICKRIAEDHGGYLTARNSELGGAVFELCLPSAASV